MTGGSNSARVGVFLRLGFVVLCFMGVRLSSPRATSPRGGGGSLSDMAFFGIVALSHGWGCSSVGGGRRSQRGGQGFNSPHLHHPSLDTSKFINAKRTR